jgi:hypothetical protein
MSGINYPRVALAAAVAAVTFVVLEIVVEGLARLMFRVSEAELWRESFGPLPEGGRFQWVNVLILVGICLLLMWLYAVLRASYGAGPRAALLAALFLWLFVLLLWANFVNLGVFPLEIVGLSLLFNLFEIPGAAIAGASVYQEKPAV